MWRNGREPAYIFKPHLDLFSTSVSSDKQSQPSKGRQRDLLKFDQFVNHLSFITHHDQTQSRDEEDFGDEEEGRPIGGSRETFILSSDSRGWITIYSLRYKRIERVWNPHPESHQSGGCLWAEKISARESHKVVDQRRILILSQGRDNKFVISRVSLSPSNQLTRAIIRPRVKYLKKKRTMRFDDESYLSSEVERSKSKRYDTKHNEKSKEDEKDYDDDDDNDDGDESIEVLFELPTNCLNFCKASLILFKVEENLRKRLVKFDGLVAAPSSVDESSVDIFGIWCDLENPRIIRIHRGVGRDKNNSNNNGSVMSLKLCSSSGLIFLMIGFETGELRMMVLMAEDEPDRWIEVRTFKLHREPIFSIDLNIKDNRTLEKFNDDMGDGGRIVCWSVGADSVIGRYQVDFQKTKNHQDESIQEMDPSKFIVSLEGHIVLFKFKVLSNTSDQSKKNGKEEEIDYNEARFDVKVRSDGKLFSTIDREGKIEIYSTLLLKNKSPSENEKNEARSDRLQGEEKCFDCQRLKLIGVLKNKAYINYRVGISTDKQQQQESNKLKNQVLAFSEVFERSNREAERNLECGKPKFDRRFGNSMVSLVGDHDLEFRNLLACSSNNSYGNIVVWEVF